jgi:elongator complex protein 5
LHKLVLQSQIPTTELPEYAKINPVTAFSADFGPLEFPLPTISEKSNIILKPISKLLIDYEVPSIFQTVQKLRKNTNVRQTFAVATTKNIQELFVVPYLEHMADLVVTFLDLKHLRILTKKSGGLVTNKLFNYQITGDEIFVKETAKSAIKQPEEPTIDPETLGTFKIGKLGKQEQLAKDALQLPYER